jgi:hypothetical protein
VSLGANYTVDGKVPFYYQNIASPTYPCAHTGGGEVQQEPRRAPVPGPDPYDPDPDPDRLVETDVVETVKSRQTYPGRFVETG